MLSIETIPQNERDLLSDFIRYWSSHSYCGHEKWLRKWVNEKQNLFKLFGEQLILKEEIEFSESKQKLKQNMYESFWSPKKQVSMRWDEFIREFYTMTFYYFTNFGRDRDDANWKALRPITDNGWGWEDFYVDNNFSLAMNEADEIKLTLENGKPFRITKNEKCFRVIRKLLDIYYNSSWFCEDGIYSTYGTIPNKEKMYQALEEYRIIQSQVLNVKKSTGTLCLSIHPLDYCTMSMNTYNWRSCMSWDEGEYHAGTIEMLNSPMVIVAYVEDNNHPYYPASNNSGTWSNKKWRELFIVNRDMISTIKAYPYQHSGLENIIVSKLRKLAKENWGHEYIENCVYSEEEYVSHANGKEYYFSTNMMYNDTCCGVRTWWNVDGEVEHSCGTEYNYSGAAICTCCGSMMYSDGDGNEAYVVCEDCRGVARCCSCGSSCYDGDAYYHDGNWYCESCYNDLFWRCPECHEDIEEEDDHGVEVFVRKTIGPDLFRDNFILVCEHCFEDLKPYLAQVPQFNIWNHSWNGEANMWVLSNDTLTNSERLRELNNKFVSFRLRTWHDEIGYVNFEVPKDDPNRFVEVLKRDDDDSLPF